MTQQQVPYSSNMVLLGFSEQPEGGHKSVSDICPQVEQVSLLGGHVWLSEMEVPFWAGREARPVKSPDLSHQADLFFNLPQRYLGS